MSELNEILEAASGRLVCGSKEAGFSGFSIDSRTIKKGDVFIALKGNNFDGHNFIDEAISRGAAGIIKEVRSQKEKSPLSPPFYKGGKCGDFQIRKNTVAVIAVEDTLRALGDIAKFKRQKYNFPVIAVTGSAGKTTVKEMIAWLLGKDFNCLKNEGTENNYIGLSLALLEADQKHQIAVLELGTNHFGEIDALTKICQPNIGVITNIGPSHLEFFHNLDGVLREKWTLISSLNKPFIAVLNNDDNLLRDKAGQTANKPFIFSFGIKEKSDFQASDIKYRLNRIEFLVNEHRFRLNTVGYSNVSNALAAITIARIFGMDYADIAKRLADFSFPQSRLNLLKINNVRFVDDSYNSNPLSLKQALDALDRIDIKGRKILVMGDMLELGSNGKLFHSQIGQQIAATCSVFVAVGELSKLTADMAGRCGLDKQNIFLCDSASQAREILFDRISPEEEDIVLVKGSRKMKMEEVFKIV